MSKIIVIAAIAIAMSVPARADEIPAETQSSGISPLLATEIADLRAYGDRFQTAVRLIEANAARPLWGWEDADCGHLAQAEQVNVNW